MTPAADTGSRELLRIVEQALDVPAAERDPWLERHCPTPLLAKARRLVSSADALTAEQEDEITRVVGQVERELTGQRIGAYRILEVIGEGGMGQVYLAERDDGAFDARVAVKVIRASAVGPRAIAQFERERQLLADLRHPNIATLLDGGTSEDGLPFVVMEFIDGVPLDVYLSDHELDVRKRLQLFLKICAAVEHAHRALVIHRDLKPSNVLVTADGEPKLLDFGIARSLAPRERGEETVAMLLTPAYASPEQITGEPLTTATDIYSLGVVLYQVLSGVRPFVTDSLSPAQFERLITEQRPEAPSQRARMLEHEDWTTLRGELDAVVLKAMAREPERRYPSVAAFADDLRRYLGGFAVAAKGDSLGYRLRKFVRRRRYAVAAGSIAFLALLFSYGTALVQYRNATVERERADSRFEQARELARRVFYDVYDSFATVPGTLGAREALAALGVDYLDELARDARAPDDILLDVGRQYTRLADLYGGLGVANLGDVEQAFALLRKAEAVLEELLERTPKRVAAIEEMLWVKRLLTNYLLTYRMDTAEAERQARIGLELASRIPEGADWALESRRWNLRSDLIKVLLWDRRFDEAEVLLNRYITDVRAPQVMDNLPAADRKLAYLIGLRGELYADSGRTAEAIEDYQQALDFYRAQLLTAPDNSQLLVQTMRFNFVLANMYNRLQQWPQAVRYAEAGVAYAEQLVDADPADAGSKRNLATQQQALAKALTGARENARARQTVLQAIDIYSDLAVSDAHNQSLLRDRAQALIDAGDIFTETGAAMEGCVYYQRSEELWSTLEQAAAITEYDRRTGVDYLRERLTEQCRG